MPARSRLLAPCLAMLLVPTFASCSEEPEVTGADPATLPEDLCAALAEEVPSDLALDEGSPSYSADDELVRAGCRWSGEGDTDLVVEVVSYSLPDADDTTPVDRALDGACRTLAGTPAVEQLVEEAGGCSGIVGSTATGIARVVPDRATVRVQLSSTTMPPEQLAARVASMTSALTGGIPRG